MLVWSMATMSTVSLAFDLEKVPLRAVDPHVTEVVVPVEPFEFPLKEVFERTNGTVEELINRDAPETEDAEGDEDEDVEDGGDGGDAGEKPKESKSSGRDKPELLHYSEGVAPDEVIYANDVGDEVKLDSKGRAYPVGSDGRTLMPSKKPSRYITPEEWKREDIAREEAEEEDWIAKRKGKKDKKEKKAKKEKKDKKKKEPDERAPKEMGAGLKPWVDQKRKPGHLGVRIKLPQAPLLLMMKSQLMVMDPLMMNGWNGKYLLASMRDQAMSHQTDLSIHMKHWYALRKM